MRDAILVSLNSSTVIPFYCCLDCWVQGSCTLCCRHNGLIQRFRLINCKKGDPYHIYHGKWADDVSCKKWDRLISFYEPGIKRYRFWLHGQSCYSWTCHFISHTGLIVSSNHLALKKTLMVDIIMYSIERLVAKNAHIGMIESNLDLLCRFFYWVFLFPPNTSLMGEAM